MNFDMQPSEEGNGHCSDGDWAEHWYSGFGASGAFFSSQEQGAPVLEARR
jgi:hypothetical protein